MSRVFATALAIIGCLAGAHLALSPASADGPLGDLVSPELVPTALDTQLICCAPIIISDPEPVLDSALEPVLESLPFPLVEDHLEPIQPTDLVDILPEAPIVEIPPEQPVTPALPPLQPPPPEAVLPPAEGSSQADPPGEIQAPAREPSSVQARADSSEPSVVQSTRRSRQTRASSLCQSRHIDDPPIKPDAALPQPANREPSDPADIPTSSISPATLLAPFDGANLFKATAGRDSILAVIAAVLTFGSLWAWLRKQQRQRDDLLVSLADSLNTERGIVDPGPTPRALGRNHTGEQR